MDMANATDLFDHTKAIRIVPLQIARSHERKDGHGVMQHCLWNQPSQLASHQQCPLRRSRIGRSSNDLDDDLDADMGALDLGSIGDFLEDSKRGTQDFLFEIVDTFLDGLPFGQQGREKGKKRSEQSSVSRDGRPGPRFDESGDLADCSFRLVHVAAHVSVDFVVSEFRLTCRRAWPSSFVSHSPAVVTVSQ